ncbi:MAG: M18 family aminopeptidase [Rhodobacteraceae bacterium]|nr:M18 family aminopeptidase [Paracoccaceae bacterium]
MTIPALELFDAARSPYHVVDFVVQKLTQNGFTRRDAGDPTPLEPGRGYFRLRGGKTIAAWVQASEAPAAGLRLAAAHTDFPALKLKPNAFASAKNLLLNDADIYDGPILRSWLDRDLAVAGKLHLRGSAGVESRLVWPKDLKLRTISVAPHLSADRNGGDASGDKDLRCVFDLGGNSDDAAARFFARIAETAQVDVKDVLEFDLTLTEAEPPTLMGAENGLLSSGRLDNIASCVSCLDAILAALKAPASPFTRMMALFDAEEIGSLTWSGARSSFLEDLVDEVCLGGDVSLAAREALRAGSGHLSVDVAHGTHPAYADKLDRANAPEIGKGVAMKYGSRGRYAVSPALSAHLRWLAEKAGVELQSFMYKPDGARGGSMGPYIATRLGVRSVDLGAPILSMHSIRELAATQDISAATALISSYFGHDGREAFGDED